ncbi:MAG TPA: NAD(P)H-binding protein [Gemmatimonadales bacterium]|nr:NAD(P)H-binding protein [Gemmatimonadales bacterium]
MTEAHGRHIFITGATGYLGRRLTHRLLARGHRVRGLVRPGAEHRLPKGTEAVIGDALHGVSYASQIAPADTFVHLVGVARPSPAKAQQFLSVDLASVAAAVPSAVTAGVRHFVYVSVAHPAPVMHAYQAARVRGEALVRESGLATTILRPWYVLGPGHWWPIILSPIYWVASAVPATRDGARRVGLVTIGQMLRALVFAIEQPADGVRVLEVPEIRLAGAWHAKEP